MAPPYLLAKAVQVVIKGRCVDGAGNSSRCFNLMTFGVESSAFTTDLATMALLSVSMRTTFAGLWGQCFPAADYVVDEYTLRNLLDPTMAVLTGTGPHDFDGTVASEAESAQQTAYCKLGTSYTGRSFRSNAKLSPLPEDGVAQNTVTATQIARFAAMFASLLAGFSDGSDTLKPYCVSRKYSTFSTLGPNIVKGTAIISASVRKNTGHLAKRQAESVY